MGMKMFILLIHKNVVEQCRDIKRNSLFIVLPIAIFICFYGYFQVNEVEVSFVKPMTVGVVVDDDTIFSQMLVDDFENKKDLSEVFVIKQGSKVELEPMLKAKTIDALVTIPSGFVESLMTFDYLPMKIQINNDDPIKTMILYNGFIGYERYISSVEKGVSAFYYVFRDEVDSETYWEYNDALSIDLIMTVLSRSEMYEFKPIVDIPSTISVKYYFIAISVMFIFLLSLFTGLDMVKEFKNHGFHRLQTTRVTMYNYISAKVVTNILIISIAVLMWLLLYRVISGEFIFINNFKMVVLLMLVITLAILGSLIVTLFINNEEELLLFSSVFVFFNAIVGGSIIPIHYMPNALKTIAQVTPNYYVIKWLLYLDNQIELDGFWGIIIILSVLVIIGIYLLAKAYELKLRRYSHV